MKKLRFSLIFTLALSITTSFMPNLKAKAAEVPPEINGLSAITVDVKTGEIIYAKNIDEKRYPASTTKLMTSLLLAEGKQKEDALKYTDSAYKQPQYSLRTDIYFGLKVGDTMSAEDVMKALMLFSANDSAYMIADNVGGSVDNFIKMMNDKAAKLNMSKTHFVTANGLHDTEHYTTSYDLSIIGRAAFANPWVKEVMGTQKGMITLLKTGQPAYLENRNKLLGKDGNLGGKTGYTSQAGKCLVSVYERDGRQIIGVVMKAAYDSNDTMVYNDMKSIMDYSYTAEKTVIKTKNTEIDKIKLQYKPLKFFGPTKEIEVPVVIKEDVTYYENDINKGETTYAPKLNNIDPWKLSLESEVGVFQVKQREALNEYKLYPTISSKDIKALNRGLYIGIAAIGIGIFALLILLIFVIKRSFGKKKSFY